MKRAIFESGRRQKDIAADVGLDAASFSRIVNGLHCDDRKRAVIADVLGRNVDELWPPSIERAAA